MHILVTGGAGFIGSHTCVSLLEAGHRVTIIDNLSNSKKQSVDRIREITGSPIYFVQADILDPEALQKVFSTDPIDAVIHFAAFKAVGESVKDPLKYYQNNVTGTLLLCNAMQRYGVRTIVFSSSSTVYGTPAKVPVTEDSPLHAESPYGRTKLMMEDILRDLFVSDASFRIAILRYFNPIGAHPGGMLGEDPYGTPYNLLPYLSQLAVGRLPELKVYGNDYPTRDGTGIRDYLHVMDLAKGHVMALDHITGKGGLLTLNLGTGTGYTVLEVIAAFEKACGKKIQFSFAPRRPGDIAENYADPSNALKTLGWKTEKNLDEMCADYWQFQKNHPKGYV